MDYNRTKKERIRFLTDFDSALSDMQFESRKVKKKLIKNHFMDYGLIDVQSMSQGRHAKDASFGVTYRTIWGRQNVFHGRP